MNHPTAPDVPEVSESALARELDSICASVAFRHSPQQQRFLRHLVAHVRNGDVAALREMSLGIDVFRRQPGDYDPKKVPIVRVEARRLRERLAQYYALEGEHAAIEIALPVGGYVPIVRARTQVLHGAAAAPVTAAALGQRAWYLMRLRSLEGYRKALALFERAVAEFPGSARGFTGMAWARICIAGYEAVPPDAGTQLDGMKAAIDAARKLAPKDPELDILEGGYAARREFALDKSERLYQSGLASGGAGVNRTSYAWLCILQGRHAEARTVFAAEHARDPYGFWHRHNMALAAFFSRDFVASEQMVREALEIEPDHAMIRLLLARVLMRLERGDEAIEQTQWCNEALPGMSGLELYHVAALAGGGRLDAASAAMRRFEAQRAGRYTSAVCCAMAYAALDEIDAGLESLSRAARERDYWLPNVPVSPEFDRFRARPEFEAILRSAGLRIPIAG